MNLEFRNQQSVASLDNFLQKRLNQLGIKITRPMELAIQETVIEIDTFLRENGVLTEDQELFVSETIEEPL